MKSVPLGPTYRRSAIRRLAAEEFDVLVVGGGVVGAGAALDAATRGLSVALVEANDWASGTSSRSSKLIHGGLRYLEQGNVRLVREALRERSLLMADLAPHLVHPVRFLLPIRHRLWERAYLGVGLFLYDVLGGGRTLPRHRHLGRRRASQQAPAIRQEAMIGAIAYYDAQVDDARLTLTVMRTAVAHGVVAVSGARVTRFTGDARGEVRGAVIRDAETGQLSEIRAKTVISAIGVWTENVEQLLGCDLSLVVRASKGVHLVVAREKLALDDGLILRTEKSVLFVIPWGAHWLIGTTDTDWDFDKDDVAASGADVEYLLGRLNAVLATPLVVADVESIYAGLRPLVVSKASKDTVELSREHSVARPVAGLTAIAGGKLTTYRVMARDAVDVALRSFPSAAQPSATGRVPLLGGEGFLGLWHQRAHIAARAGLSVGTVERLLRRYGWCIAELLDLIAETPSLAEPIAGADEYINAEVVYAVTHEDARHLDDVLVRRTRIAMETQHRGTRSAEHVAKLMAHVLGWDATVEQQEIARFLELDHADRDAARQPNDRAVAASRGILHSRRLAEVGGSTDDACGRPTTPTTDLSLQRTPS